MSGNTQKLKKDNKQETEQQPVLKPKLEKDPMVGGRSESEWRFWMVVAGIALAFVAVMLTLILPIFFPVLAVLPIWADVLIGLGGFLTGVAAVFAWKSYIAPTKPLTVVGEKVMHQPVLAAVVETSKPAELSAPKPEKEKIAMDEKTVEVSSKESNSTVMTTAHKRAICIAVGEKINDLEFERNQGLYYFYRDTKTDETHSVKSLDGGNFRVKVNLKVFHTVSSEKMKDYQFVNKPSIVKVDEEKSAVIPKIGEVSEEASAQSTSVSNKTSQASSMIVPGETMFQKSAVAKPLPGVVTVDPKANQSQSQPPVGGAQPPADPPTIK